MLIAEAPTRRGTVVPLLNIIIAYIGQAHVAHRAIDPSASYSSTVAPRTCAIVVLRLNATLSSLSKKARFGVLLAG